MNDQVILVTGGTGSFGKAFVRHILSKENPKKVIVFSRDELKQYEMAQEFTDPRIRFFLGDVRDLNRLNRAFAGVDYVVHAAALKQVPAAEYNPLEFIKTNVYGSQNVIDAALDAHVRGVIALSTDKAVNPANLYGATKLCAEKLFIAANSYSRNSFPKFSVVRYGNVAGSRGSVIPLFLKQRDNGRVYSVTDTGMTRYWIKMSQAIELVLLALKEGHPCVYVPKIPSSSILRLVEAIDPEGTIKVTGIRPGEKLHEALLAPTETGIEYNGHFLVTGGGGIIGPYTSDTNKDQLSVGQLRELIASL